MLKENKINFPQLGGNKKSINKKCIKIQAEPKKYELQKSQALCFLIGIQALNLQKPHRLT